MAEFRPLGGQASKRGWFERVSDGHVVFIDESGNVRCAIDPDLAGTVGAVAADGTLVSDEGFGRQHFTKVTFTDTLAAAGAALAAGALAYTMPAVPTILRGVYVTGTLTAATETGTPEIGVGTLVGSGANATLGAVGATAENIIEGAASEAFASGGTSFARNTVAANVPIFLAASSVIHVNYALSYTASENVTVAGTLYLDWAELA